jgi:N-acetylmuramoyl-L-alanine amidase
MSYNNDYNKVLLALVVWREARGEIEAAKVGVAWTIRNRVMKPGWWGTSWISVILKPFQFSSFNHSDPNATKMPDEDDHSWDDSLNAAYSVYTLGVNDPTGGATHYFDKSLDSNPPSWAAELSHKCDIGNLHFYG